MKAKSIVNIVFYRFFDGDKEIKKACIFYRDGSMKDTTYSEGIDACEEIVKERNITSGNVFKEMINRDIVHVMSAEDFRANYNKFVCHEPLTKEIIEEIVDEKVDEVEDKKEEVQNKKMKMITKTKTRKYSQIAMRKKKKTKKTMITDLMIQK